jgi:hypothetical protein
LARVADASVWVLTGVDVPLGRFDDFTWDGDPCVATASQPLDLRDGRRAFVVVLAILGADVAPAAGWSLRFTTECDRTIERFDQIVSPILQPFFPEHLG